MNAPANTAMETPSAPGQTGYRYTETEKLRALAIYAETNSVMAVERSTTIPHVTVARWLEDEDNQQLVLRLRTAIREQAAWNYIRLVELAQRETLKRLEHGDPHVTKDGDLMYVPVRARDAILIASVAQDKLAALTATLDGQAQANKQLNGLAKQLLAALRGNDESAPASAVPSGPSADSYMG